MGPMHCNTDGRIVLTAKGAMFKNKPHLFNIHKNYLGHPMNFSAELSIYLEHNDVKMDDLQILKF